MDISASDTHGGGEGEDEEAMNATVTVSHGGMARLVRELRSLKDTSIEGVIEKDLQTFKVILETLCSKLKDLAEEESPSFMDKGWMEEVRNLCYDTEDYLDKVKQSGDDESALIKAYHRGKPKRQRQFAADFSVLRARAKGAEERYTSLTRYSLPAQSIKPAPAELSVLDNHEDIPKHTKDLAELLDFDASKQLKVVSIFGIAGVGKTTLARSIYHKWGTRFEYCAFVRVSRNPDMRRLLISMLSQIKGEQAHVSSDVHDLFDNINKLLQQKRYLIVIDDLWASMTWDIISRALPRDNGYSRIIITTQTRDVAMGCCSYDSKYAFEIRPSNYLQSCGKPFETTIMVDNLLRHNLTEAQPWHLQISLLSSLRANPTSDGMKELLDLIYGILPHHLKTCLLYFCMYPEGYTIKKDDLVKQWVAEEFIGEVNEQDRFKVAEGYFHDLITKGLIQEVDTNYNKEVLSCTVHHIVLDFIRYKSKEENFISIADYFQTTPGNPDRVRRLSVQFGGAKGAKIPGSVRMSHLRSLICFGFLKCVPSIAEYGLLRVLTLHVWADKDKMSFDLSTIQELFQLKYLKIACNVGVKLPDKIRRLKCLETLDLDARVVGFPSDIYHLQRLLHLRLPCDSDTNMPNGVDKMTSLGSLAYFPLSKGNVLRLGKLTNLQDLHLTFPGVQTGHVAVIMRSLGSILEKFSKLKTLVLDAGASTTGILCDGLSNVPSPPHHLQKLKFSPQICIFPSLPEWIGKLNELAILKIAVKDLPRNNVEILKRLTGLTVLSLSVQTAPAERVVFDEGFQALRYFKFTCPAPCLSFVQGTMVKVERLKLCFNADSKEQYDPRSVGFEYLTSLKVTSVKFGDKNYAERTLQEAAVIKHPGTLTVSVQSTEGISYGDNKNNESTQEISPHQASETQGQGIITGKDSDGVQKEVCTSTTTQKRLQKEHQPPEKVDAIEERGALEEGDVQDITGPLPVTVVGAGGTQGSVHPISSRGKEYLKVGEMEVVAMSASKGVLEAVLVKLGNILMDEYKLQRGVKDGIRYIRKELESMQIALEKVSKVPPDQLDNQVKHWARKMREMSYNIENTIDSFTVRVDSDAGESGSSAACCPRVSAKSMLPRTYKARRDIAAEINRIKEEVEEVSKRRERYKVDSIFVAPASYDPRLLALYEDKEKLVGIDHSTDEIIKLLSMEGEGASEQKLKLVSIVGPGGMGKTTLANAVYKKLEEQFDCTAFVSVSLQPNVKNILSGLLRQVTASKVKDDLEEGKDKDKKSLHRRESQKHDGNTETWSEKELIDKIRHVLEKISLHRRESQKHDGNTETWSEKELIDKIRHVLEKRRYLIVIDDIWDEQPWKFIKCALFENKLGSKVITTTRKTEVAKLCCSSDELDGIIHQLQPLSDGDSEKLLYYKIFGKEGCPTELKDVSQKILKKCEGCPLAINAVASLLANKPAQIQGQWNSVFNSISTGLENNYGEKDMWLILSLSYNDMPAQLRDCLLYLSIFPEDYIIGRDDLIQRWIAEDLVHGRQDDNLYELGDKYFNELINRSMIQPIDVDAFGRAQACKVHDLVLDFISFLSAEEAFVTIFNGLQSFPPQLDNIHRLSLRNREGEHGIPTKRRMPNVRTLVVSSRAVNSMPSLSIFPVLRVLELEQCTERNIKGVENLVHLRYLRLTQAYHFYDYDVCINLPKGIGNLQFLQTLDLKEARIEELPSSVVQFSQLRVLEISLRKCGKIFEKHLIQCLCNAKQLEALCIFAPSLSLDFMLQVDWTPTHLRRFTAFPRQRTEHILRRGSVWATWSPFSTLPMWINSSLSGLSDLSMMVRTLRQEDIEILANLLMLRSVDLEVVEATGTRLHINGSVGGTGHATAFQCLGNLKFASRAMGLVFRPGAMQKLQKLYLCFDVAETKDVHGDFDFGFPGLQNLTSLKTVNVELDCRCSRLWEVEAADAALRNATNLNPNRPTLDLERHFEGEMLFDQQEEIPDKVQANKKEDALLSRVGPFGGNGGRAHDIRVAPHRLEDVTIHSGTVVHSLAFSYTDHNGQQRSAGPWGSCIGSVSTIHLGPSEYLIKVSGTIGSCFALSNLITSLTFVTNAASYGPFGEGGGDPFVFPVQSNSSVVGFFGRAGAYIDAIGFYVRPL